MKKLIEIIKQKTHLKIKTLEPLAGGFNCDIFKGIDDSGAICFIKRYRRDREFSELRLAAEFNGLTYLWKQGIRSIPEPYASVPEELIAVYEYIDGIEIPPEAITKADVEAAIRFWKSLDNLKTAPGSGKLPVAKEACFSLHAYIESVSGRLDVLMELPHSSVTSDMKSFLQKEIKPFIKSVENDSVFTRHAADMVPEKYKTLSPSDFGFHNAIRKKDGTIIFHDFEYFGWDDPAKMIADFFLHPRMGFPKDLREHFYNSVYTSVADPDLPRRLPFVYQVLAVKWCLIMLNTFKNPNSIGGINNHEAQLQLLKAKQTMDRLMDEIADTIFPLNLSS